MFERFLKSTLLISLIHIHTSVWQKLRPITSKERGRKKEENSHCGFITYGTFATYKCSASDSALNYCLDQQEIALFQF